MAPTFFSNTLVISEGFSASALPFSLKPEVLSIQLYRVCWCLKLPNPAYLSLYGSPYSIQWFSHLNDKPAQKHITPLRAGILTFVHSSYSSLFSLWTSIPLQLFPVTHGKSQSVPQGMMWIHPLFIHLCFSRYVGLSLERIASPCIKGLPSQPSSWDTHIEPQIFISEASISNPELISLVVSTLGHSDTLHPPTCLSLFLDYGLPCILSVMDHNNVVDPVSPLLICH